MGHFTNKVVIITGASSGIGKALVYEAAMHGMKIVAAARRKDRLEEIAADVKEKYGVEVLPIITDVCVEEDCKRMVEEAVARFGKIDILINNAGISMRALFEELDLDVMRRVMDVNFWGTIYCTKHALPHVVAVNGSIVGVSSIAGYTGLPGRTAYSASKFAMHGFLGSLRIEYLRQNVHVMIACPNFTSSEIRKHALNKEGKSQGDTPMDESKLMSSELVAKKIMRSIRRRKNYIVITGIGKLTVLVSRMIPHWYRKRAYVHFSKEPNSPLK